MSEISDYLVYIRYSDFYEYLCKMVVSDFSDPSQRILLADIVKIASFDSEQKHFYYELDQAVYNMLIYSATCPIYHNSYYSIIDSLIGTLLNEVKYSSFKNIFPKTPGNTPDHFITFSSENAVKIDESYLMDV